MGTSSGPARVGMMYGITVLVLLIPLPGAPPWRLLAAFGTVVATTLLLSVLLALAAQASATRLAVVATVVVALVSVAAATVLSLRTSTIGVLGFVVIVAGGVLHRVVVTIVERFVGADGPLALVAGVVGTVAYAFTTALAVVGGTTDSLGVATGIGVVVGLAEGVLAGWLLRRDLAST